jgi:hypothetical protein
MVVPTVWVVTASGSWVETTDQGLDDTVVLATTKDASLHSFLEDWFQRSRATRSSAIKSVAMEPKHDYHIGVEKFLENKDNLRVTECDVFYQTTCVEDGHGGYFFLGHAAIVGPGTIDDMNKLVAEQDMCLFDVGRYF